MPNGKFRELHQIECSTAENRRLNNMPNPNGSGVSVNVVDKDDKKVCISVFKFKKQYDLLHAFTPEEMNILKTKRWK
jgi:hypothetical protein